MLFGAIFGAAASLLFQLQPHELALFVAISAAASLLPDLDMRRSKASKLLFLAALLAALWASGWIFFASGLNFYLALLSFCALLLFVAAVDFLFRPPHRGVMHSLLFLAALWLAAFLSFGSFFASALAAGYLSHLVADRCIKII